MATRALELIAHPRRPLLCACAILLALGCSTSGHLSTGSGTGTGAGASGETAGMASGGPSNSTSDSASGGQTATSSGTGGSSSSTGLTSGSGSTGTSRCDQATLSWNGPTANVDGSCLNDLTSFELQWGNVSGGPYSNSIDVGLPCTAGPPIACGDGGFATQLACSYELTGLTNGTWYFVALAVAQSGVSPASAEASKPIQCACNGCACTRGAGCPPFQMCDTDAGLCDDYCTGGGCACATDSQCAGLQLTSGLGQGQICVGGFCAAGCNAATDCGPDVPCDLTNGAPGVCGCTGTKCACAMDSQCNGRSPGQQSVCGLDHLCTAGCKTAYDCPAGAACDQSQGFVASCTSPCAGTQCSCLTSSQCGDGGLGLGVACLPGGLCGAGCATGDDCGPTESCNTVTAVCAATCATAGPPAQCACLNDTQCSGGLPGQGVVCNAGFCFSGCRVTADCATGKSCLDANPDAGLLGFCQ